MRRGFTLIELMIVIAMLGIVAAMSFQLASTRRASTTDLVLRERARQLAEYEAELAIAGTPENPGAREALLAMLPEGRVETKDEGRFARIAVAWRAASGRPASLELTVARGKR